MDTIRQKQWYLLPSRRRVRTTVSKTQLRTQFQRVWKRIDGQSEIAFCEQVIRSSNLSNENTCLWLLGEGVGVVRGRLHCVVLYCIVCATVIDITVCIICM